jgi:predicted component of type VI protein secretion system
MQVVLVMFKGDQRRSFSVTRDMTVIGRREDCDLRIPLGDVSRKHCRLIKDDGTLRIEDLGSSNGTFINGERVQQAELTAGDTLQVGPVVFVAQVDGQPEDDALQPVIAAAAVPEAAVEGDESGLAPTAQSDAGDGEFDPMEALNADGSVADFNIEDALNEVTDDGGNNAAAVGMDDSEVDALDGVNLDEVPAEEASLEESPLEDAALDEVPLDEVPLEEAPVDLEDAEHDQKA